MSIRINTLCFLLFCAATGLIAQTRLIPHVTSNTSDFVTTVFIENKSVNARTYQLTAYTNDGQTLAPVQGTLDGQQSLSQDAALLFSGGDASHFAIEGEDIVVTVSYAAPGGSPAHVAESTTHASSYRLYPGNWDEVFDGFAVVNPSAETLDIWVSQITFDGDIVKSVRAVDDLAPMGKGLFLIGFNGGNTFESRGDVYYEIYAKQSIAVTALRGNLPGSTFLWASDLDVRSLSETTRDAQNIWFIRGGSLYDVHQAMGYSVASDRLWQSELFRRTGSGRLAELFGENFLDQDIFTRSTSYSTEELQAGFESLDEDSKTVLKAYVDGFNRRIAEVAADETMMPLEFQALGLTQIEPWTVTDVLGWMVSLTRAFDPNGYGMGQLDNAAIYQTLQNQFPETAALMFEDLRWHNDPDTPTMISTSSESVPGGEGEPAGAEGGQNPAGDVLDQIQKTSTLGPIRNDVNFIDLARDYHNRLRNHREQLESINAKVKMGSYAWAISGERTESGNPTIYTGPQMGFQTPAIAMEGSIQGGGMNISGMVIAGLPGFVIGRTPYHAWSMQVGHAHTADLYLESDDILNDAPHHTETIGVAGREDEILNVYRTGHGPLVSTAPAISWKYAHWGYEFDTVAGILGMARSKTIDDFGAAVGKLGMSQHLTYVDREGNIAYWMSGRNPFRPEGGEYRLPQWTVGMAQEYDISTRQPMPHDRNSERGYYGGWNNKSEASYANGPFGAEFNYGVYHRAHMVQDTLDARFEDPSGVLDFDEIRDLAINISTTDSFQRGGNPWAIVGDVFTQVVEAAPSLQRLTALEIMADWDGHFVEGGPVRWISGQDRADAWMLMDAWIRRAVELTFNDELGQPADDFEFTSRFNTMLHALDGTSLTNNYDWFTNLSDGSAPQTFDAVVLRALDDTLVSLGNQPWGEDARGSFTFFHDVLGVTLWESPFYNRSTYAHCVEMGSDGPTRIQSVFPLGQSANIYSDGRGGYQLDEHFTSMARFFDAFSLRSFPLFD